MDLSINRLLLPFQAGGGLLWNSWITFPFLGVFLLFSAGLYVIVMVLLFAVNTGMRRSGVMDGEKDYLPENMEKLIENRKVCKKVKLDLK